MRLSAQSLMGISYVNGILTGLTIALAVASCDSRAASGVGDKRATAALNFKIIIPPVLRVEVPADGQVVVATNVYRGAVSVRREDIYEPTMVASNGRFEIAPAVRYITGALP